MTLNRFIIISLSYCLLLFATNLSAGNRAVGVDQNGFAQAVVVNDKTLAHTTQLLPTDSNGVMAKGDVKLQTAQVISNLKTVLEEVGSGLSQLVRLNVYAAKEADVPGIKRALKEQLTNRVHPAVTIVVTALPNQQALLAIDAIASVNDAHALTNVKHHRSAAVAGQEKFSHVTLLPKGGVVYISGMAERSTDLAEATTGTLRQLEGVLKLLGLNKSHVISVKAYMKPMANIKAADAALARFFDKQPVPPVSYVEWTNGLPIEIEMIAACPTLKKQPTGLQHRWQPMEKQSPVYCRFTTVDHPTRIYIAGLTSHSTTDADSQVRDIFAQLKAALQASGSNFLHLVKATYYVAADDVSKSLNTIRPELYNPKRPPAASKASVVSTGDAKRTITVDMIAVPAR